MTSTGFEATSRTAFGRGAENGGDDLAEHGGVALEQTKPGFPRPLRDAGREDDDVGPVQRVIAAGAHEVGMGERRRVQNVLRLSGRQFLVEVSQDDLVGRPLQNHRVGRAAADRARSDNADFHPLDLPFAAEPGLLRTGGASVPCSAPN